LYTAWGFSSTLLSNFIWTLPFATILSIDSWLIEGVFYWPYFFIKIFVPVSHDTSSLLFCPDIPDKFGITCFIVKD
jgi:hypothetical protein